MSSIDNPLVASYSGTLMVDWHEKASAILDKLSDVVSYSYNGVGLFGEMKISSLQTSTTHTFKVDAKGKAKGLFRLQDKDSYIFVLFLMAFSKTAPFDLVDRNSETTKLSCSPNNPFFSGMDVSPEELNRVGVLLGLTISDEKRRIKGSAAFF